MPRGRQQKQGLPSLHGGNIYDAWKLLTCARKRRGLTLINEWALPYESATPIIVVIHQLQGVLLIMLNALYRFLSDMCWRLGAENLSMRFLLMSLDTKDTIRPTINIHNSPKTGMVRSTDVIWEDPEAVKDVGDKHLSMIPKKPKHAYDIN